MDPRGGGVRAPPAARRELLRLLVHGVQEGSAGRRVQADGGQRPAQSVVVAGDPLRTQLPVDAVPAPRRGRRAGGQPGRRHPAGRCRSSPEDRRPEALSPAPDDLSGDEVVRCQAFPSKRLVTEPSANTWWMASASSGAIGSTVICGNRFSSGIGNVSVKTTSHALLFASLSDAEPDSTPCVAATITSEAPSRSRISTVFATVPPVSIMSSMTTQSRPSTSPTTRFATASLGRAGSRVLWTNASDGVPSVSAQRSASRTRPESGETTATG